VVSVQLHPTSPNGLGLGHKTSAGIGFVRLIESSNPHFRKLPSCPAASPGSAQAIPWHCDKMRRCRKQARVSKGAVQTLSRTTIDRRDDLTPWSYLLSKSRMRFKLLSQLIPDSATASVSVPRLLAESQFHTTLEGDGHCKMKSRQWGPDGTCG
jgi:hypothetical protein